MNYGNKIKNLRQVTHLLILGHGRRITRRVKKSKWKMTN